jgi:hypothetical protein
MRTPESVSFTAHLFGGLEKGPEHAFQAWGVRHDQVSNDHAQNGRHDEARASRVKSDRATHNAKKAGLRNVMRIPDLASIWTGGGR